MQHDEYNNEETNTPNRNDGAPLAQFDFTESGVDISSSGIGINIVLPSGQSDYEGDKGSGKMSGATKPFLKWPGGKRWFVKEYGDEMKEHVLARCGRYIEPFVGGGSMALHLGLDKMVIGDIEQALIWAYVAIRDSVDEVIACLKELADFGVDEMSYYAVREEKTRDWVESAAQLLYLNKLGFNGLYRRNSQGKYNVAYGKQERAMISDDHLRQVSAALQGADIRCCLFQDIVEEVGEGDVVYADPPYYGTFNGYTGSSFSDCDQRELADLLKQGVANGADFFAHNSDDPVIREMYDWATIIEMPENRMINRDGEGRGKVPCVLITNVEL